MGCILNRMQGQKIQTFSTERSIPNGIQFEQLIPLQIIYFSFLSAFSLRNYCCIIRICTGFNVLIFTNLR